MKPNAMSSRVVIKVRQRTPAEVAKRQAATSGTLGRPVKKLAFGGDPKARHRFLRGVRAASAGLSGLDPAKFLEVWYREGRRGHVDSTWMAPLLLGLGYVHTLWPCPPFLMQACKLIPVGADLELIRWKYTVVLLRDGRDVSNYLRLSSVKDIGGTLLDALDRAIDLYDRAIQSGRMSYTSLIQVGRQASKIKNQLCSERLIEDPKKEIKRICWALAHLITAGIAEQVYGMVQTLVGIPGQRGDLSKVGPVSLTHSRYSELLLQLLREAKP